jgi:hypothetical protein
MENLRITLAAGETKVFVKAGRYFEIIDSTGPVTIGFYDRSGSQNNDATNVLSGFYLAESYSQFDIYSGTAQTVEIFISDASAGTRRQPGVVQVVDTAKATTQAGTAFAGKTDAAPAATLFGAVQLWNPAGSGKRIIVESLLITNAATAQNIIMGISPNTAPNNDGAGTSKLSGGAAASGQIRKDAALAAIGATYWASGIVLFSAYLPANGNVPRELKRPIILMPGFGLAAVGTIAATTHGCAFDWYEEVI